MARLDHLFELQQHHLKSLLARRNVTGVGVGLRIRDGKLTDEHVIGVTVDTKARSGDLAAADVIPQELEVSFGGTTVRAPTDIVEMRAPASMEANAVQAAATTYQSRRRPLQSGYSLGSTVQGGAGTTGCFLARGSKRYALTNLHVVTKDIMKPTFDDMLQPGKIDRGDPAKDRVGRTATFMPFAAMPGANSMDAALVELDAGVAIDSTVPQIGQIDGWYASMNLGWKARAVGRTSGYVEAHCTNAAWFGVLTHGDYKLLFNGLQLMHTFPNAVSSQPGDSGMVWVTEDRKIALLNGAGGGWPLTDAYGTPFGFVMNAFKTSLIVTGGAKNAVVKQSTIRDPDFSPEVWKRIEAMSRRKVMDL